MTKDVPQREGPFRLLVGLKPTEEGRHALLDAVRIARRIPGCALHVLQVVARAQDSARRAEETAALRARVDEALGALGGPGTAALVVEIRSGDAVKELTAFAQEIAADLVVLGSDRGHRASWDRAPTVERLGEAISCPIVVTTRARPDRGTRDAGEPSRG